MHKTIDFEFLKKLCAKGRVIEPIIAPKAPVLNRIAYPPDPASKIFDYIMQAHGLLRKIELGELTTPLKVNLLRLPEVAYVLE